MSDINPSLLDRKPLPKPKPWWQKRAFNSGVALLGLLLIIVIMTINVTKYESHLATGDTVLLALAPVDPRGFMQGDYMTLSYALELNIMEHDYIRSGENAYSLDASEGYVIVAKDSNNVGQFVRIVYDDKPSNLATNEMALYYRMRNGSMKIATNAYFFQEGHAQAFEAAEYGLFRVNKKGEPLLTDMVNGKFEVIVGNSKTDD